MVLKTAPEKPTSYKPVEQFRAPWHREITRLAETDPMPPGKLLGRETGKSLNTYVQYVEDFKFWVMAAGNAEKEIVEMFVSGLKPEIFREEIYSHLKP